MPCATFSRDDQTQRSFSSGREPVIGWLTVDYELALTRKRVFVCCLRAEAAQLFVDCKQQPDAVHAVTAKLFGGKNLRGDDAFRITRTAAINIFAVFAGSDKRRHCVHVS